MAILSSKISFRAHPAPAGGRRHRGYANDNGERVSSAGTGESRAEAELLGIGGLVAVAAAGGGVQKSQTEPAGDDLTQRCSRASVKTYRPPPRLTLREENLKKKAYYSHLTPTPSSNSVQTEQMRCQHRGATTNNLPRDPHKKYASNNHKMQSFV